MSDVAVDTPLSKEQIASSQIKKKRIALIFTGGTIAVTTDKNAGLVPNLKGKEVLDRIPEVGKYLPNVEFEVFDFATLPGPHMSPEMMLTLKDFVRVASDDSDGIVITHGTDSMEETAYFLDLTLGGEKPVVVTGAMHHSLDTAWDGGSNIIDAIAVASSEEFKNEGVLIVMNGTIHHAAEVTKAHTMRADTFRSPEYGPLGSVDTLSVGAPQKLGCLFAPYLNGQKARLKLILALSAGCNEDELSSLFPLA